MITRRRAKMATNDVNNQMGVEQSENSAIDNATSGEEIIGSRARGHESMQPEINLNMLIELIRNQNEETRKQQNEELRRLTEELRKHNEEMHRRTEERITKSLDDKIEIIKENLQGQIHQVNDDLQKQSKNLEEVQRKNESGIKEISKEIKKQTKESREIREKDRKEWQDAIINMQNQNKQQIEGIVQQVRNLKEAHQNAEEKLNDVSTEKGRRLDEIANNLTTVRESQQRVQRRLEEME